MYYLYDYHIHTIHSLDGNNTIYEMCNSAIEKGLSEIAFTDHFEPTKEDPECKNYKPNAYLKDLLNAKEKYRGRLRIKAGVELGQPYLFPEVTNILLKSIPYDYVLGSVHKINGSLDVSSFNYRNIKIEDICKIYLDAVKQMVKKSNFDCVGHIDLIKRYGSKFYNSRITLMYQEELLREVLKLLIYKGKGIEINTSGLRQGINETMPGLDVLKLYKKLGGEILTIGSDAHFSKDVGEGLKDGIELAKAAGFSYMTIFNARTPYWIKIDDSSINVKEKIV